jgi:hypothetical protein
MLIAELQQTTDEKFKKLKEVYTKLQQEHVILLKTVSCEHLFSCEPCQVLFFE